MNQTREHALPAMIASIWRDTLKNIQRNNLMSFASVVSIVAALIILGIFIIITINIDNIAANMEASLQLKVFLINNPSESQVEMIEEAFKQNSEITDYEFQSRDEALEIYTERLEDYSGLLDGFNSNNNPVRDSFTVSVSSPQVIEDVKGQLENLDLPGIDYIKYGENYIDAIMFFKTFSRYVCIGILIVLSVISIIIIYNTIKLTCYSSRKEIEIMKFIGAEDWYIKMPFFIEGLALGIFGALLASLLLLAVYTYLIGITDTLAYFPLNTKLVSPETVIIPVLIFSVIYGIFMGSFGSLFSIRKYFYA